MNPLEERITAGKELAVRLTQEAEPEVSWFVDAIQVRYDSITGEPASLAVFAHLRSAHHYYLPPDTFGDPSVEEIAQRFIAWIRDAMQRESLVADDPPMGDGPYPSHTRIQDRIAARLAELYGGVVPPEIFAAQKHREERERKEWERQKVQIETLAAMSNLVTYTYDSKGMLLKRD